jgi:hypothetical protein
MSQATHRIHRQTIELVLPDELTARAVMDRVSAAVPRMERAAERALDRADYPGLNSRIERIEITLPPFGIDRLEAELIRGIEETVAARVAEKIAALGPQPEPEPEPEQARFALRTVTRPEDAQESIEHFASFGRMPWWFAGKAREGLRGAVALVAAEPARYRAWLKVLLADEAVRMRFATQLADETLEQIVELAGLAESQVRALASDEAVRQGSGGRPAAEVRRQVWIARLAAAAGSGAHTDDTARNLHSEAAAEHRRRPAGADLARRIKRSPGLRTDESPVEVDEHVEAAVAERLQREVAAAILAAQAVAIRRGADLRLGAQPDAGSTSGSRPEEPVSEEKRDAVRRQLRSAGDIVEEARDAVVEPEGQTPGAPRKEDALSVGGAQDVDAAKTEESSAAGLSEPSVAEKFRIAKKFRSPAAQAAADAGIAVSAAGLTMLWPFLPEYFKAQQLMEKGSLRDAAARHRAAVLLHHLATGEMEAPEEQLPLIKVLAGVPLDAVHEPGEPLTAQEAAEGELLLEAVLVHARALGRLGVPGLRSAYLSRTGILTTRDGHWLLRVDGKTHDILLSRLPWPRSWVVFPWMQAALQVEW